MRGSTGRECLKLLSERKIIVDFFCDDDEAKWGLMINVIKVVSSSTLRTLDKEVCLIITSIYTQRIYNRLIDLNNIIIYELFQIYGVDKGLAEQILLLKDNEIDEFKNKLVDLDSMFEDDISKQTLKVLGEAVISKKTDINHIRDIVSSEECYFIKEVLNSIDKELKLIDAGAYTGKIIRILKELNINFTKIYCFEVESMNYKLLSKNTEGVTGVECINNGLWEKEGVVYIEENDSATKVVDFETECKIDVVSIDNYFSKDSINFIKMDIEGSEMKALKGGQKVIKRDRPILAISIYHSINDFVDIPLFLNKLLDDYHFYLRHHSMIFAETVLYCIPNEKLKI